MLQKEQVYDRRCSRERVSQICDETDPGTDKTERVVKKAEEEEGRGGRRKEGQSSPISTIEKQHGKPSLLSQPMGIPIEHLLSRPPPIVSILLGLIYHVTSYCRFLLLG